MRLSFLLLAILSLGCSSEDAPPATDSSTDDTSVTPDVAVETSVDSSTAETVEEASASDSAADSSSDGDSAGDSDSAIDSPTDGEVCNSLVLGDTDVSFLRIASDPPSLSGGTTISDGTYILSKFVEYTGAGGASGTITGFRSTLSISGGTYALKWLEPSESSASAGTVTHGASSISLTETCPGTEVVTFSYAATPTSLQLSRPSGSGTMIQLTYDKK